jgi:hypothetical protein
MVLFYAAGYWNAFFNTLVYLSNRQLFPPQISPREILIMNEIYPSMACDPELAAAGHGGSVKILIDHRGKPFCLVRISFRAKTLCKGYYDRSY